MQGEAAARPEDLEPEWRRAFEWVGRELGGRVVRWEIGRASCRERV